MAQKQPAVVIIARHGPRLDAADQNWHLSTPTPYDPPLTYGGWNQCRALGIRIATLLHAREQAAEDAASETRNSDGVTAYDFALGGGHVSRDGASEANPRKRKRKHKVVIHTSPFLRCVQSSIGIAAGMAQFHDPSSEPTSRPSTSRTRTPSSLHSASPRLRAVDGMTSPSLAPISEPREDLAHAIARRVLGEHKRHSKFKLRVDAFLGEWLNPEYFENITPPPPSAMMVTTAKAELMHNETVDIFSPTLSTKSSGGDLWGGARLEKSGSSKDDALEDWNEVHDTSAAPVAKRDRASSTTSIGSTESGRLSPLRPRSPFRSGHVLQPSYSAISKPENAVYVPPTPQYAVSSADQIPRGYVSHARQACVNADYQWDSSRPPQDWGDGGELGEEWSSMHKRFRRGLNHLIQWYSQHNADDRAEDALGFEQAEHHSHDNGEEEEELVLVLVTHGAGSNALIGALTGQPVLLDVGMASLTMGVKRDDVAPLQQSTQAGERRASGMDLGLSSVYEMKLVSSSDHLRPPPSANRRGSAHTRHQRISSSEGTWGSSSESFKSSHKTGISSSGTNSNLGSMRRPSAATLLSGQSGGVARSNTTPAVVGVGRGDGEPGPASPPMPAGLWTPPAGRTPVLQAQMHQPVGGHMSAFSKLDGPGGERKGPSNGAASKESQSAEKLSAGGPVQPPSAATSTLEGSLDGTTESPDPMTPPSKTSANGNGNATKSPQTIGRALSHGGLWGAKSAGDRAAKAFGQQPKRRWTATQEEGR